MATTALSVEHRPEKRDQASQASQEDVAPVPDPEQDSLWYSLPVIGGITQLYDKYDPTFLTMLGMQYFNQGTKVLVYLASSDLFKTYYDLDPGRVQAIQAFTFLPWSLKIFYGLVSDNLPIFGSRRKSYLIIGALLQFFTMIMLGLNHSKTETLACWMLFLSNLSIAFSDVIVDSLMVMQARKFPNGGAEELNSFSWTCMSFGGFFGAIAAAILTQRSEPHYCFMFSSVMGLVIAIVASRLNMSLEHSNRPPSQGLWKDIQRNFSDIQEAFRIKEFYSMILYIIIGGFLVPNFGSFGYYFMLDVVKISKFSYSMLTVLGFACLFVGTLIYKRWFHASEYKSLIMMDALISIILAPISFIFVLRLNVVWGIPDMFLIIFTDVVSEIVSQCFVFLPMSVVYAKICPKRIEATSFALLSSVSNFRGTIRSWLGTFINQQWVGVSVKNLDHYWVLVTISFCCSFLPLFFLWLIPSRDDINKLQVDMIESEEKEEKLQKKEDAEGDLEAIEEVSEDDESETSSLLACKSDNLKALDTQSTTISSGRDSRASSQSGVRRRKGNAQYD